MAQFNKHIIILGSARSGTSWLCETIAKQHRYRLLFEPDHEFQTKKGVLLCDKWIESASASREASSYLKKIFANRVNSNWIAQNSNRKLKRHLWPFIPKKIVVKFVRANLMAPMLQRDFGVPVIQIIRNPYDVIASQKRVKFPWLFDLSHFKKQLKLVLEIKERFGFDLAADTSYSQIEVLTIRWCIENCDLGNSDTIKKVHYESLRGNIKVFKDLCEEFNLRPVDNLAEQFSKPSSKTHSGSAIRGAKSAPKFSNDQLLEINNILDVFNISAYKRQHTSV